MSDDHYRLLTKHRENICKFLDPVNGVIEELVSNDIFSDKDRNRVLAKSTLDAMAIETIDILSRKADAAFDLFIASLHKTGQGHVATILRPDSANIPMSSEHCQLLAREKANICSFLDPEAGVVDSLERRNVFSDRDRKRVTTKAALAPCPERLLTY